MANLVTLTVLAIFNTGTGWYLNMLNNNAIKQLRGFFQTTAFSDYYQDLLHVVYKYKVSMISDQKIKPFFYLAVFYVRVIFSAANSFFLSCSQAITRLWHQPYFTMNYACIKLYTKVSPLT